MKKIQAVVFLFLVILNFNAFAKRKNAKSTKQNVETQVDFSQIDADIDSLFDNAEDEKVSQSEVFSKLDEDYRQNVVNALPQFAPQVIIFSKDDLFPIKRPSASIIIDLPAPVSPINTFIPS